MLLTLTLPRINEYMTTAVIETVYAADGTALRPGAKLFDLSVDLSKSIPHDCPPISYFRLALREAVWLRRLVVAKGDELDVGAPLAQFSTAPDEPLEGDSARAPRVTIAGIIFRPDWWSDDAS